MSPIKAVWLWIRWGIWEPTFSNQQLIPSKKGGSIALIEFHSSCPSYHHPICWKKAKNSTLDWEIKILKMANSVGNRSFHWKTSDPNLFWVEKISVHVHSNSSSIETMLRQSSVFFCRFFSSNCVANVIFGAKVGRAAGELGLKHSIKTHVSQYDQDGVIWGTSHHNIYIKWSSYLDWHTRGKQVGWTKSIHVVLICNDQNHVEYQIVKWWSSCHIMITIIASHVISF